MLVDTHVQGGKRLLQNFVRDFIDGKNLNAVDNYLAPNFLHHDLAPGEKTLYQTGRNGTKNFFGSVVFPAFSNFSTSFEDVLGEKDLVAGRWRQSVRQTGAWLGRAPSNKQTSIGGISIVRIRSNVIVEEWEVQDAVALLVAFNVICPPKPLEKGNRFPASGPTPSIGGKVLTGGPLLQFAPDGCDEPTRSLDEAKAVAGQFVTQVFHAGNVAAVDRVLAPTFVDHDLLDGQTSGPEGVKQFVTQFKYAFPDSSFIPDIALAEGDLVVIRWTAHGTQKNTFLGVPASGRSISVAGINMYRIQNQKIVEKWGNWPLAETLQQLGSIKFG
jgi:steroid delta-isomerase-like uncharacterized protein